MSHLASHHPHLLADPFGGMIADAFVVVDQGINAPLWEDVAKGMWDNKPQFLVKPPVYVTAAVAEFVKTRLSGAAALSR